MNLLRAYLNDFAALLFPQLCQACNQPLVDHEDLICTDCLYNLPYTHFHQQPDNIVIHQFWGKVYIKAAYALFYFTKGGKVQQLMHQFKYKNKPAIGKKLGVMAGNQLKENNHFKTTDVIIPVPLHKSRLRKRGYNQSACFAEGIATVLNIPVLTDCLIRKKATQTQTKKSRYERTLNMQDVFEVVDAHKLAGKNILLVDDVVTTGATLEACALALLAVKGLQLNIATIAYAE